MRWDGNCALSEELGKEFSEALERRKREVNIECSNGINSTECGDGCFLSLGYKKSEDGDYINCYDDWEPVLDVEAWAEVNEDISIDELDE